MFGLPGQEAPLHKVPVLGDAAVGKTCIVDWIHNKQFNPATMSNVGVSTTQVTIKLDDKEVPLSLWDTAGQETYRSLVPLYTRNAAVILLVFDISERKSFRNLVGWMNYIRNDLAATCPVMLVCNKIDRDGGVPRPEIREFAESNSLTVNYTSAVTGQGIEELFNEVATLVITKAKPKIESGPNLANAQKKKGCC